MNLPLVIYTDGSGTVAAKLAAIGVVVCLGEEIVAEVSECIGPGTNNVAEVRAIGRALAMARAITGSRDAAVTIRSDSEFALGAVAPGSTWQLRANPALAALALAVRAEVARWPHLTLEHVPGHAGVPGNERADALAGRARKTAIARAQGNVVDLTEARARRTGRRGRAAAGGSRG